MAPFFTTGNSGRIPGRPNLPGPKETGWTKRGIDGLAAEVATKLNYSPGADLEPIIEKLGGRIETRSPHEAGDTGFLEVNEDKSFTIALSTIPGKNRNRFTIAHELGHYFLHSKRGQIPIFATRQAGSRVEWEANWFAGGFLMPANTFVEAYKESGGIIGYLIDKFKVSGGAIEIRIATLKEMGKL